MKRISSSWLRRACLLFSVAFAFASASAIPHWSSYPASGYRNNSNGSLNNVGSNGYVWLSSANSQNNAYNLNFNSSNVNPQNNNNRANGNSVRPVQAFAGAAEGFFIYTSMKLDKNTLDKLLTIAYLDARRNERTKRAALSFELDLENNLRILREELWARKYRPAPPVCFVIDTPREVFAPLFRDRIVSHLLFNMIAPLFDRTFIFDSYSCRKGKGTLSGIRRLEKHMRSCTGNYTKRAYVLHLDISGYFMSIDKGILYSIICAEIRGGRRYAAGSTIRKFAEKAFEGQSLSVLNSYLGYLKHFRADKATGKIIQPLADGGQYMFADNSSKVTFKDVSL